MNSPSPSADLSSHASSPAEPILLDALDHRQDEVLRQLEALDERIAQLVASCQRRTAEPPA